MGSRNSNEFADNFERARSFVPAPGAFADQNPTSQEQLEGVKRQFTTPEGLAELAGNAVMGKMAARAMASGSSPKSLSSGELTNQTPRINSIEEKLPVKTAVVAEEMYYHRRENSTTQTPEVAALQEASGEI